MALADALREAGVEVVHEEFFDTVLTRVPGRAAEVVGAARAAGVHLRQVDDDHVGISTNEVSDASPCSTRCSGRSGSTTGLAGSDPAPVIPAELARGTTFMTHEVFNTHRSETAMLRYLRRLSARDYALDRGMIPLGSCTMKLNATTEMEPVSLPGLRRPAPVRAGRGRRGLPRCSSSSSSRGWPR